MNDDEWRQKVDEHLLRDLIEDLQDRVKEIDIILRGEKGKSGLVAEYDRHDDKLTRLYAVIFQDPTGQKGLLHDVDVLMQRRKERVEGAQFRWQFWGLILTTIISSAATLILNWDKILKSLPRDHPGMLEAKIERSRHPKSLKKIVRYHIVPPPLEDGTETEPKTPNEQKPLPE